MNRSFLFSFFFIIIGMINRVSRSPEIHNSPTDWCQICNQCHPNANWYLRPRCINPPPSPPLYINLMLRHELSRGFKEEVLMVWPCKHHVDQRVFASKASRSCHSQLQSIMMLILRAGKSVSWEWKIWLSLEFPIKTRKVRWVKFFIIISPAFSLGVWGWNSPRNRAKLRGKLSNCERLRIWEKSFELLELENNAFSCCYWVGWSLTFIFLFDFWYEHYCGIETQLFDLIHSFENEDELGKTLEWNIQLEKILFEKFWRTVFNFHLLDALSTARAWTNHRRTKSSELSTWVNSIWSFSKKLSVTFSVSLTSAIIAEFLKSE